MDAKVTTLDTLRSSLVIWSKCQKVLDWIKNKVDIHTEISKQLLGKDQITKEERSVSKVVTFASIYGSEGAAVSRALNIPIEEGMGLVEGYNQMFPEIVELRNKLVGMCHRTTFTKTICGRLRKLPNIKSNYQRDVEKAERQAFNTAIQASCADCFKLAGAKSLKYKNEGVRFVFGVFDSILLQVPEEMTEERVLEIVEELSDFNDIFPGLKFGYNVAIGHTWKECADQI